MLGEALQRLWIIPVEVTMVIDRPVEEVFAAMVDLPNLPRWVEECVAVDRVSAGPLGVGTTFRQTFRLDAGRPNETTHETRWEVTEFVPNRVIRAQGPPGAIQTKVAYKVAVAGAGTQITARTEGHLDDLVVFARPLLKPLLTRMVRKRLQASLTNLKTLLESSHSS